MQEKVVNTNDMIMKGQIIELKRKALDILCLIANEDLYNIYAITEINAQEDNDMYNRDNDYYECMNTLNDFNDIKVAFLRAKRAYKNGLISLATMEYKTYVYILSQKLENDNIENTRFYNFTMFVLENYHDQIVHQQLERKIGNVKDRIRLDEHMLDAIKFSIYEYEISIDNDKITELIFSKFDEKDIDKYMLETQENKEEMQKNKNLENIKGDYIMQEKIASIKIANTNNKGIIGIQMNLELPLEDEQHTREILTNLQSDTKDKFFISSIFLYSNTKEYDEYEKFKFSEDVFTVDELIVELKSLQTQIEEMKEASKDELIQNLRDDKEIDIAKLAKSARFRC